MSKLYHKKISDLVNSSECPVVNWGYLDTTKQSMYTQTQEELHDLWELLKYPVVVRGYLVTKDQADIQEEKKYLTCIDKIMLCAFAISVFSIIGFRESIKDGFGLFVVLIIYLTILLHWTIQK